MQNKVRKYAYWTLPLRLIPEVVLWMVRLPRKSAYVDARHCIRVWTPRQCGMRFTNHIAKRQTRYTTMTAFIPRMSVYSKATRTTQRLRGSIRTEVLNDKPFLNCLRVCLSCSAPTVINVADGVGRVFNHVFVASRNCSFEVILFKSFRIDHVIKILYQIFHIIFWIFYELFVSVYDIFFFINL